MKNKKTRLRGHRPNPPVEKTHPVMAKPPVEIYERAKERFQNQSRAVEKDGFHGLGGQIIRMMDSYGTPVGICPICGREMGECSPEGERPEP